MSEDWGPWIEHDGRGCPLPNGTYVQAQGDYPPRPETFLEWEGFVDGHEAWDWSNLGEILPNGAICGRITHYRIRKPRGLTILQEIAADPQPIREPEHV